MRAAEKDNTFFLITENDPAPPYIKVSGLGALVSLRVNF